MDRNKEIDELRSDEAFAELLGKAPPRPAPPASDESMIREAVRAEWQQVAGGHVRRRNITTFALAASVLLAVFATLNSLREPVVDISDLQMAMIEKQFGEIRVNSLPADSAQIAAIAGDDLLETADDSGIALGWHNGGSLRLDENTIVVFEAGNQIYLQQGRIYFDSEEGPLSSRPASTNAVELLIRTDHGVMRHLGTQYMTSVDADELVVSVRDGIVSIVGAVTATAPAGKQYAITGAGELSIEDTNGVDDWKWVEKSTPAVNLEGRFVSEALDWASRESGHRIRYMSDEARELAHTETLQGDWNHVEPSRAVELFMMTVDLNASFEDGEIVISED